MQTDTYWIQPDVGDPLPSVGSGFRRVLVQVGRKWVKVKPCAAANCDFSRISLKKWQSIPKLRCEAGQSPAGKRLEKG
jgi:hypothetical protein